MRSIAIYFLTGIVCLTAHADDAVKPAPSKPVAPVKKSPEKPADAKPPANPKPVEEPVEKPAAVKPAPPAAPAATPPVAKPAATPAQIDQWIRDLNSDRYEVREAATRQLGQAGSPAVGPLLKAAEEGNLEVSARAIRALQTLYFQPEESVYGPAEKAIEKLSASPHKGVARRASGLTSQQVAMQQQRAIQRLETLGALIRYEGSPTFVPTGPNGEKLIREVHLDEKWTGGDTGLSFIRHLATTALKVYLIEGSNVTKQGEDYLLKNVPGITIQYRGRALLGVAGATTQRGCEVLEVKGGTGAEKAGLQPGDVFVKYDGIDVKSFEDVIEATRKHRAGDKVKVEVLRGFGENPEKKVLTVTLGGWREYKTSP